jgi:hypothetical protein
MLAVAVALELFKVRLVGLEAQAVEAQVADQVNLHHQPQETAQQTLAAAAAAHMAIPPAFLIQYQATAALAS